MAVTIKATKTENPDDLQFMEEMREPSFVSGMSAGIEIEEDIFNRVLRITTPSQPTRRPFEYQLLDGETFEQARQRMAKVMQEMVDEYKGEPISRAFAKQQLMKMQGVPVYPILKHPSLRSRDISITFIRAARTLTISLNGVEDAEPLILALEPGQKFADLEVEFMKTLNEATGGGDFDRLKMHGVSKRYRNRLVNELREGPTIPLDTRLKVRRMQKRLASIHDQIHETTEEAMMALTETDREAEQQGFKKRFDVETHKVVWDITCSKCKTVKTNRWGDHISPQHMTKNINKLGWALHPPICKDCQRKPKETNEMNIAAKNDAPAPDPKIARKVYAALEDHFFETTRLYAAGWNDSRIAEDIGCSEEVVKRLRVGAFGELAEDPAVSALRDAVEALRKEMADTMTSIFDNLTATQDRFTKELQRLDGRLQALSHKKAAG